MNEADPILTLVRHPADASSHVLLTEAGTLRWRKTPALCGAVPPAALGWQEHHSARVTQTCPICALHIATAVVKATTPVEAAR